MLSRLAAVRRRENISALIQGIVFSVGMFLGALLLALLVEDIFYLSITGRTLIFWGLVALACTLIIVRVAVPLGRLVGIVPHEEDDTTARKVGRAFPEVRDRLLDAMQLAAIFEQQQLFSPDLVAAALEDFSRDTKDVDFRSMVSFSASQRWAKLLGAAVFVCVLVFVLFPTLFFGAAGRLMRYNEAFASPAALRFVVTPGDSSVVRGESVAVTIRVEGNPVPEVMLHSKGVLEDQFVATHVKPSPDGAFHSTFSSLKTTMQYYARSGNVRSNVYTLSVIDRPVIKSLRLTIVPPSYSGLPTIHADENVGDVSALRGTRIHLLVGANKGLSSGKIEFSDGSADPLVMSGAEARGLMHIMKERSYHIVLWDSSGTESSDPVEYTLKVIPDAYPTVSIVLPGASMDVTDKSEVNLAIRIADDFGFSGLRLGYTLIQSRYERPSTTPTYVSLLLPPGHTTEAVVPYLWKLAGLHLVPEDVLSYFVEVADNDNVSGPKKAVSETYTLRLPSLDEVLADADLNQSASTEEIQQALEKAEQARKELNELRQSIQAEQNKVGWEERQKAEEILKKYQEITRAMEEAANKVDQLKTDLQKNQLLSRETLEKYQELQHVMAEMNSPEFAEAMKKLQQAMEQMSPEAMKNALKNFSFSEENFRKSIERTLALLKRIQIEQKLDAAIHRGENIVNQQEQLQKKTAEAPSGNRREVDSLAQRQKDLKGEAEELQKQLEELQSRMEEFPAEMPLAEMQQSTSAMRESNLGEKFSNIAQSMQQGEMGQAQEEQGEALKVSKEVLKSLKQTGQALHQQQQREILNAMRRSLNDMLELSQRQEALKNETEGLEQNSERFRENAEQQLNIVQDLGRVTEHLASLSKKSFSVTPDMGRSIGNALRSMHDAMQSLDQRNKGAASRQQTDAMGSLNETAQQMQAAISAMTQGGGPGMGMAGFLQRLRSLSGEQQGINQSTKDLERIAQQQAAAMSRLAAEQGMVRKSLEQLTKEASAAGDLQRMLGDLTRVAEDMREVQTDLAGGNIKPETTLKQDRILSRLLDAQRSIRERDYEKERQSTAGRNIVRPSPAAIDLTTPEGKNQLRRDLQRAMEEGYAPDYEELIRRYFESLEREESR
jgi:hypothetical protein